MHWNHPAAETILGIPGHFLAWAIVITGLLVFGLTIYKRWKLMRLGRPDPRFSDLARRLADLIKDGFLQRRQPRYLWAGISHIIIFWGFVVLALHSFDLVTGGLGAGRELSFMTGMFGAAYNSLKDIFEFLVLAACLAALYHRAVIRPERYRDSRQFEAYLVLGLIIFLMLTDMVYESSRLVLAGSGSGFLLSARLIKPVLSGAGPEFTRTAGLLSYWLHFLCFFFFLNLLPLSKHFHIITALPNVFFKNLNQGALKPARWEVRDIEEVEDAGTAVYRDFTWKHILDFFSCAECGRCADNCPANAAGQPLSPKRLTINLRDFGYSHSSLFSRNGARNLPVLGEVVRDEEIWACTTCGACERECPVFIEYIDKIVDFRRRRVLMDSRFPPEVEQIYRHLETYGDAWGTGPALREDWARGLGIKNIQTESDIDVLYWVGCAGAFDSRSQQVALSFVKIMRKAGVRVGILGPLENCCGDYARRTGNEYLFQFLAKKNIEILRRYNIRRIVTTCPHGYNCLKNEYPRLGGDFEVRHAMELIFELINNGKLTLTGELNKTVIYHDPCYLGRHNGIYDIPRKILSLIPGTVLIEADRHGERSFCCGAGGGHFWMESSGPRLNDLRTDQLLAGSPEMIATACPYCLIMLEDGVESREKKGQVPVRDIIEVVADMI